jgi:MFS family permease
MTKNKASSFSVLGWAIWLLAALFFLYEFFLRTFVGTVAHQVIPDLHLNAETFAFIGSAYYVTYGLMQIPVGILADKFGAKICLLFACIVCASATLWFAHTTGFVDAFISRLLMGLGSAFGFICLLVVVINWFPRRYFGSMAGISQFIGTMGPLVAAGPLVALMTSLHETWRTALTQVALFAVILAFFILLFFKNKPKDKEQVLVFLIPNKPLKQRLLKLAKNSQAWLIASYSTCNYVSISLLAAFWGTEFLQAHGLAQSTAANIISACWLGFGLACPGLGALSDLTKRRKPLLFTCSIIGLVATGLIIYLPDVNAWGYGILFFLLGVAASGQNLGFATISEQVSQHTRATALGLNNCVIMLFNVVFPPFISHLINAASASHPNHLQPSDFTTAFTAMPLLYLAAAIISAFFIKETYCKPQREAIRLNV